LVRFDGVWYHPREINYMVMVRFEDISGEKRYGIVDLSCGDEVATEAELIEGDIYGQFRVTGKKVEVKNLLAPVEPPNVFAIGLNYRDHAAESGLEVPAEPLVFLKATSAVIGPGAAIVLPKEAPDEVDYEAELAVIIGRRAKDVPVGSAREYILGYTCGNDVSARDCQLRRDKQWTRGKSFDTFCPLGPWIVTEDDLDPCDLGIRAILSGEVVQDSRTSQMVFSAFELVSFLSRQFTLLPGTVIMTGTPSGVGFGYDPPKHLRAGDEVVIEIEGIGRLRNPVAASGAV